MNNNILQISVRADFGGGPKHLDLLIQKLDSPVWVACPPDDPYYKKWAVSSNVVDICLLPHRKFTLKAFFRLVKFCKKNKIKTIHSHGKGAGVYSRLLKLRLPNIKVIHTYHGVPAGASKSKNLIYFGLEKLFEPLTDSLINVSEGEKAICEEHGISAPNKTNVIYNGIDSITTDQTASASFPILTGKFVVAMLSRFDISKNMQEAYAIAYSLKHNKNIVFLWIGDGPDKKALEDKAKADGLTNIVFTGFRNDVDRMLSLADACLSTSRHEGLPFALIEAFSLKKPVIASDVVGNNEVVEHGKSGFLYPLGSPEVAAQYISTLQNNPEIYQAQAQEAYKRFKARFSASQMIDEIEKLYAQTYTAK